MGRRFVRDARGGEWELTEKRLRRHTRVMRLERAGIDWGMLHRGRVRDALAEESMGMDPVQREALGAECGPAREEGEKEIIQ